MKDWRIARSKRIVRFGCVHCPRGFASMRKVAAALAIAICSSSATGQVPGVATSEQMTREALAAIQRLNPALHAVIAVDPTAIEQARRIDSAGRHGPLAGEPVLLKDNIEAAGPLPTTAGSLALANNVTNRDAPLVAPMRDAGAR